MNSSSQSSDNTQNDGINIHKNSEYYQKTPNKKLRVRSQLVDALQHNPEIARQLQQNPQIFGNFKENLRKKLEEAYNPHHNGQYPQDQERLKHIIYFILYFY